MLLKSLLQRRPLLLRHNIRTLSNPTVI
jgi:hypothetical protein